MTKGNEPAFPIRYDDGTKYAGLTKRQFIAIKAMQGLLGSGLVEHGTNLSEISIQAYQMADAMLEEWEK